MLLFAHIKILNFNAEMALVPMRIVYTLQMNWRFRSWHLIFEINKPSTHIQQYDVHHQGIVIRSSCPESTIQKIWRWLCLALKSLTAYSEHIFLIYVFLSCMEMKNFYTSKALVTQLRIHLVKHLTSAGPEGKTYVPQPDGELLLEVDVSHRSKSV